MKAFAWAMEILTRIGDVYKANEMVEIDSAHTNMTRYHNIMDAGVNIFEKFSKLGAKYRVLTTLDIAGMDLRR